MSFVPRRSARLAAKSAHVSCTQPMTIEEPVCKVLDTISKEQARLMFLASKNKSVTDDYKQKCVNTIKQYLNDVDAVRGKTAKAVIATRLMHYLLQNPIFMGAHERFHKAVLIKMEEFKEENTIPDAVIDTDFRKAAEDLLFVVA